MRKIVVFLLIIVNTVVWGYSTVQTNNFDKIVFEGFGKYVDMSTSQQVEKIIEEENIDIVKLVIVGNADFKHSVSNVENLTQEEADDIIYKIRSEGLAYHKEINKKLLESLPDFPYENIYVSKYFPQIVFDVKYEELFSSKSSLLDELAKNELINTIYVQKNDEIIENIGYAKTLMDVHSELSSGTLTGRDIRVGIIDGGIIDTDNPNLINTNIVNRDEWYFIETESEHATTMASCISGTYGIAQNASIYCCQGAGNPSSEIDWLMENGVHVINCSYGYGTANGVYSSHSATYDYTVWRYNLPVIVASGNESASENDYYVSNPGLAYNVVTVGGAHNISFSWGYSCFEEVTNVDKPTIINAANDISIPNIGSGSGTSYSCAFTTGCAALLMEHCADLKIFPAKLTALLSGCSYRMPGDYDSDSGLDDEVGCGLIDFAKCKESIDNCFAVTTNDNCQADDFLIDERFYLEAGQQLRMAVAWCGKSEDTVSSWQLNNYTLCLFRPSGAQIACSYSLYNNVLLIQCETEYTGNYRVVLIQEGDLVHTDPTNIYIHYSLWPLD